MEFEIIETNLKNYSGKVIPLIVKCPEFFEKFFFNNTDTYKINFTDNKQSKFGWTIQNFRVLEKYNLEKKFWLTNIEKI